MKQPEQPLYPKLSPIYNKILQLFIAILLIVFLMNFWVKSRDTQQIQIQEHANKIGKLYLAQAATSATPYLSEQQSQLQQYTDSLVQQSLVKSVHIYDLTGQIIASSEHAESINDLFGINVNKINQSNDVVPFVQELRTDKLYGYIRLSLYRSILADDLADNSRSQYDMMRLLMIVAGVIGFLLTRGLNRFSRQGYRPPVA
ncbi:MAG: AhpA/YtjB family protein [Cognaticolwellia sp.]